MFSFLKPKKRYGTGLLPDSRPQEEKAKDYSVEELYASFPVEWREKSESEWKKFPIFDQDGSGSCFPFNAPVLMEDLSYKPISKIKIGDIVITHRGNKKKVIKLFKRKWQGTMTIFKIRGIADDFELTNEHPIYAIKRKKQGYKPYNEPANFYKASELEKGDWVAFPIFNEIRDTTITSRYSFIRDNFVFVQIASKKIKKSFQGGHVYNIEVEDDNSYIVNGVAVHNCVAMTIAKLLGIENWREEKKFVWYSARDVYTRRKNKDTPGMMLHDAFSIGYKYGATVEQLMPSQGLGEEQMNKEDDRTPLTEQVALLGRGGNYFFVPVDIDAIAYITTLNKGVGVGFRFSYQEWNREVPVVLGTYSPLGHMVTCVDFTLYRGEKALIIEDSWSVNSGIRGRRIITETFFRAKFFGGGYFEDLPNKLPDAIVEKPKYKFSRQMAVGSRGEEVAMLQRCLGYLKDGEGWLFPLSVPPTGYFGGITLKAVKRFQKMFGLEETGSVNLETLKKLNETFSY